MTQESGRIWVMGGRPLNGTAAVPAAKNSVLPLLAAALLCRGDGAATGCPGLVGRGVLPCAAAGSRV
ncbi:hypothetical protein [Faecalibacterium sp.]|uniref:hypothetical protein n=1 Tax=Faecalibacterium sp. TaxID=1971605 RepID=UPI00399BB92F